MSRTTIEIEIRTDRIDEILSIITNTLSPEGYQEKLVDGEHVWCLGDGVFEMMKCFNVIFTGKGLIVEAWTRELAGESSLDGFVGKIPKKKMRSLLGRIQNQIVNSGL